MPAAARGVLVFLISFFLLGAQEPPPTPIEPSAGAETGALGRLPFGSSSPQPQAYEKVITKDAKSKTGLFTVHEIKDNYYYEIPKNELHREFLFVTQIARTTLGVGYGGQFVSERVVRWERNANKINREVNYEVVADGPAFTLPAGFPVAILASSGDEKPFYRGELRALDASIAAALARTTDRTTRVHLEGARDQIARILDPKFNPTQGAGAPEIRVFGDQWSGHSLSTSAGDLWQLEDCWPDYEIKP
jgi:hypothetical protein